MIPYWAWTHQPIPFLGLELHLFGMFVGAAVVVGTVLAQRRAEELGVSSTKMGDMALLVILLSFFMAHQVSLFAYFPERFFGTPCPDGVCPIGSDCLPRGRCDDGSVWSVFEIWNGISSFGGFLGAAIALALWFNLRKVVLIPGVFVLEGGKGVDKWKFIDALAYGFGAGWILGRLGCFSAHDHVGRPSESFLAVNFPDGWRGGIPAVADVGDPGFTPRFDLGLLEVFWAVAIFAVYHFWARKQPNLRPGWYAAVMCISYAPYRFYLDTLRAVDISGADTRYLAEVLSPGITPGQIGAVVVFFIGVAFWVLGGRAARQQAATAEAPSEVSAKGKP